jgi:hypothetical protein
VNIAPLRDTVNARRSNSACGSGSGPSGSTCGGGTRTRRRSPPCDEHDVLQQPVALSRNHQEVADGRLVGLRTIAVLGLCGFYVHLGRGDSIGLTDANVGWHGLGRCGHMTGLGWLGE